MRSPVALPPPPRGRSAPLARNHHIHRIHHLTYEISEQNAVVRDIIARCLEVLKIPTPDTFLGRKTQEPFPEENAE